MVGGFYTIFQSEKIRSARVLLVVGDCGLFNRVLITTATETCKAVQVQSVDIGLGEAEEETEVTDYTRLDFDTFIQQSRQPPMLGSKWYCVVQYSELTAKQTESFKQYIKNPGEYGQLIVEVTNYKDAKQIVKSRVIQGSQYVLCAQLTYPKSQDLVKFVSMQVPDKRIADKAYSLMLLRLANHYNEYEAVIDDLRSIKGDSVTYDDMRRVLQGKEYYELDDMVARLLSVRKDTKPVKLYKMLASLLDELPADKLLTLLRRRLEWMVEIRRLANNGLFPISIIYSVAEVKSKLESIINVDTGEIKENRYGVVAADKALLKISDAAFRRWAKLAQSASLRDINAMMCIIDSTKGHARTTRDGHEYIQYDEDDSYRHLLMLIHRRRFTPEYLTAAMEGIDEEIVGQELWALDTIRLRQQVR